MSAYRPILLRVAGRLPTEFAAHAQPRQASENPSQTRKSVTTPGTSALGGKADAIGQIADIRAGHCTFGNPVAKISKLRQLRARELNLDFDCWQS